jgi:periplasmic protein TonB
VTPTLPSLRNISTLSWALGISLLVHAALLTVRFVDPERFNRVFQDTPLEVILVNSKSNERPDMAKAIAQSSLAGGGELEKGRATTPLPPSALSEIGDSTEDAQKKVEAMQVQQTLLLTQIKKQLAALPVADPKQNTPTAETAQREEKRRQLLKLLAEIERRINEENARPKKRYISPATREEVYAIYYDGLRRRIEDKGTQNFPEAAGNKLYGELTMIVTVNFDGRVLSTEVVETSGNLTLDRRAQAIARSAGPFGRFSDAMRARADQIVVVSRFKFTRDETLETKLTNQ